MNPEVTDLDGADPSSSRAGLARTASVVLALSALASYAALSSPVLRGPFATPDPSGGVSLTNLDRPRYTPVPTDAIDNAAKFFSIRCVQPGAVFGTTVFVNGQPVRFAVPLTASASSMCSWSDPRVPFERFAR